MNLIININTELHSVKASAMGEAKTHSAIKEAIDEIMRQSKVNTERAGKGLKPLPYNATVKDEYGKDLVVIKKARTLEEIREEYQKKQDSYSFENKEKNLLASMNEIGNSEKNEFQFKEELNKQLNSALFINDVELSPSQERILDYFGNMDGVYSTIDFKKEISAKCIKDLIDLPDPKTGKPPKIFEHLLSNIMSISKIFNESPKKEDYLEIVRNYINLRYNKIVPENYKEYFKNRGNLLPLVLKIEKEESKTKKINKLEFEVSEKNFKKLYQSFCDLPQFKNNSTSLVSYLLQRVPSENKKSFTKWMISIGFKDKESTYKILTKWSNEKSEGKNLDNKDIKPKGLREE